MQQQQPAVQIHGVYSVVFILIRPELPLLMAKNCFIFLEWNMTPVDLPLPLALINTKVKEAGKMWLWKKEDTTRFHISVGPWSWRGKSTSGTFPDWQQIITSKPLPYTVNFSAENALQLQTFLKSLPEAPPNNPVRLTSQSNKLAVENGKGLQSLIPAEFSCDWKDFSVTLNKEYLLRALLLGHQQLGFRAAREPFMASGGVGQYTAMPLLFTSSQPVKEEKIVEHNVTTAVATPGRLSNTLQKMKTPLPIPWMNW